MYIYKRGVGCEDSCGAESRGKMKALRRQTRAITFLIVVLLSTWPVVGGLRIQGDDVTEVGSISPSVDAEILDLMAQHEIPSLQAGIVLQDQLVWVKGYGAQSSLDTVFMIGSITKLFTATAILQLYERGVIDLDADITDYLPFEVRNPRYPDVRITIRMLLTHTAGLAREVSYSGLWDNDEQAIEWANENLGANITLWERRPSLGEFVNGSLTPGGAYYSPDNWQLQPGTQWRYSGAGFLLLSYLVEQVTEQPFADYVQENILDPLGMANTGYRASDFADRNAIPYERRNGANFAYPVYDLLNLGGAALRSTVRDLAQFMIAHMNQGRVNGVHLFRPETVELMQEKQFSLFGSELGGLNLDGQGLGLVLFKDGLRGHGGACPGYLADILFRETEQGSFGMIVMLNRGSSLVEDTDLLNDFYPRVIELLLEEAERMFEDQSITLTTTLTTTTTQPTTTTPITTTTLTTGVSTSTTETEPAGLQFSPMLIGALSIIIIAAIIAIVLAKRRTR